MSGAHRRTEGELQAQTVKRRRRYAASVGKGYCQLFRKGHMCPDLAVKQLAGIDICQYHVDLLEAIRQESHGSLRRRQTPKSTCVRGHDRALYADRFRTCRECRKQRHQKREVIAA